MTDTPTPPAGPKANSLTNRLMAGVIALLSLMFGAPMAFYGAVTLWAAFSTGQFPALGEFLVFIIGLAFCAFAVAIGWAAVGPKKPPARS